MHGYMRTNTSGTTHSAGSKHPGTTPSGRIASVAHYFPMTFRNGFGQAQTYDPSWSSSPYAAGKQQAVDYDATSYQYQNAAPRPELPKLTTSFWEDQGTLCFQVDARGICVARRQDNDMINGTKLLNVTGISRGKRDGILKNEKGRAVVKVGAMHLKGVWITMSRAKALAAQFGITDILYPLFEDNARQYATHFIADTPMAGNPYPAKVPVGFYAGTQTPQEDSRTCSPPVFHPSSLAISSPPASSPHMFQGSPSAISSSVANSASTTSHAMFPIQEESWSMSPYSGVTTGNTSWFDDRLHSMVQGGNHSSILSDSAPTTPDVSMMQLSDQSTIQFQPFRYSSPSPPMFLNNFVPNQALPCNEPQQPHTTNEYQFYNY